jgi:hypothetical protein
VRGASLNNQGFFKMAKKHGGVRPGAGRKTKEFEQDLGSLLKSCVTGEQRAQMLKKLAEDSLHLSFKIRHESRKLLLSYLYGRPVDRLEVSGEGGGPIPITIIEPIKPNA